MKKRVKSSREEMKLRRELQRRRKRMNALDRRLALIIVRRIRLARAIIKFKVKMNLKSYDPRREREIAIRYFDVLKPLLQTRSQSQEFRRVFNLVRDLVKLN